jgi:hypothetical protein
MAESAPMRIDVDVKSELETLKDRFHAKTHSDAVQKLITYYNSNERQRETDRQEREREKQRRNAEDVHLGGGRKEALTKFQNSYHFRSPADAIDFLLEAFYSSPSMGRLAFDLYAEKMAAR